MEERPQNTYYRLSHINERNWWQQPKWPSQPGHLFLLLNHEGGGVWRRQGSDSATLMQVTAATLEVVASDATSGTYLDSCSPAFFLFCSPVSFSRLSCAVWNSLEEWGRIKKGGDTKVDMCASPSFFVLSHSVILFQPIQLWSQEEQVKEDLIGSRQVVVEDGGKECCLHKSIYLRHYTSPHLIFVPAHNAIHKPPNFSPNSFKF